MGERHFRRALNEFVEHYHRERNHQGLDNQLIDGRAPARCNGRIRRRPRLGGLLNYYERAADSYESHLGSHHPCTAVSRSNLELVLNALGDGRAKTMADRWNAMLRSQLGEGHPTFAGISLQPGVFYLPVEGKVVGVHLMMAA